MLVSDPPKPGSAACCRAVHPEYGLHDVAPIAAVPSAAICRSNLARLATFCHVIAGPWGVVSVDRIPLLNSLGASTCFTC
jgi:hypothetical protein